MQAATQILRFSFMISLFLFGAQSLAQSGTATTGVNFRAAPNGTKLGGIPQGASFSILRREGNWYVVEYGGRTGYVYSQYVNAAAAPAVSTPTSGNGVATAGVNFRASPNGTKWAVIPEGGDFNILRREGNWYVVNYNGTEGYVYGQYVQQVSPTPPARPTTITPSVATTPSTNASNYVRVTSRDGLNFRDSPNGTLLTALPHGTNLEVIRREGNWTVVRHGNSTGYVYSSYVEATTPASTTADPTLAPAEAPPITARVVPFNGLNVRSGPSSGHRKVGKLTAGTEVQILGQQGSWTQISYNNQTAYVYSRYLSNYDPDALTEAGGGVECENCSPNGNDTELFRHITERISADSDFSQCITDAMIRAAKERVRTRYGNRRNGGGDCALAVRQSLNDAGIWYGGGIGHARDTVPGLRAMGFENILRSGMTPDSAPDGAILVYGRATRSGCGGLGSTYGHIEIKESNNSFLYDGNPAYHIQEAYAPECRPLIGVMVMGSECPTCTASLRRSCGGE